MTDTDYLQKAADYCDIDRDDVDQADLVAWALRVDPSSFYSCDADNVPEESRMGITTDMEVWVSLNPDTREAALVIAAMNQRRPVDIITMGRIAEHMAEDPIAVLCLWGVLPPPPHVWTDEQTKALHVCARIRVKQQ